MTYITDRSIINLKEGINRFIKENNREPRSFDFDDTEYLPSSKTIQRKFGGLKKMREKFGLNTINFTSGPIRSKTARASKTHAQKYEKELYGLLFKKYHDINGIQKTVERELEYNTYSGLVLDKKEIRSDSAIVDRIKKHIIFIDFFYANDIRSLYSCVGSKRRKIARDFVKPEVYTYESYFVCVNPSITQEDINKRTISTGEAKLISMSTFTNLFL